MLQYLRAWTIVTTWDSKLYLIEGLFEIESNYNQIGCHLQPLINDKEPIFPFPFLFVCFLNILAFKYKNKKFK